VAVALGAVSPSRGGGGAPRPPLPPPNPPAGAVRSARTPPRHRRAPRPRRAGGAALVLLAGLAVVAGVLSARGPLASDRAAGAPVAGTVGRAVPARFTVGLALCSFVERTATPTYDYVTRTSSDVRVLETEIRYPTLNGAASTETRAARPALRDGPYPVIVFAHGYAVTPDTYQPLLDTWVRAGFVVVAPLFPNTNHVAVNKAIAATPGSNPELDLPNQPGDLAYLTRQVAAGARAGLSTCRVLRGLVDPAEIGLAGQSDGAETVGALAYDGQDAGLRAGLHYAADVVMSGQELAGAYSASPGDPPLLVIQSATDECNPPQGSTTLYNDVRQPDKWFLEILHAPHLGPYDDGDPDSFPTVAQVTTRFFQLELRAKTPAAGFLSFGNRWPSVARISTGPSAPALPRLPDSIAACYAG